MTPKARPQSARLDLRPAVCGYVRAEDPDEDEILAWKTAIQQYCDEQDFRLETVFVDRRVSSSRTERPGIGGLLGLPGVIGVVVPDTAHLSADREALVTLHRWIARTNSEVLCIEVDGA